MQNRVVWTVTADMNIRTVDTLSFILAIITVTTIKKSKQAESRVRGLTDIDQKGENKIGCKQEFYICICFCTVD